MICAFDHKECCWAAAGRGILEPIYVTGDSFHEAMNRYIEVLEEQEAQERSMEKAYEYTR